jgi:hypothetical protein
VGDAPRREQVAEARALLGVTVGGPAEDAGRQWPARQVGPFVDVGNLVLIGREPRLVTEVLLGRALVNSFVTGSTVCQQTRSYGTRRLTCRTASR